MKKLKSNPGFTPRVINSLATGKKDMMLSGESMPRICAKANFLKLGKPENFLRKPRLTNLSIRKDKIIPIANQGKIRTA